MKKNNSWALLLTATLIFIGIILSSQATSREKYLTALESQTSEDLLVLWRSNDEKISTLQNNLYTLENEYKEITSQTNQGKISIESFTDSINNIRVFNGDAKATGPGLEITLDGEFPLLANEFLNIINELNNSGAEAISINDKRITSRTYIEQISTETGFNILIDHMLLTYPVSIKAIGDYNNLYGGLTIIGGLIDKLNTFYIYPALNKRDDLILPKSSDQDNYKAYSKNM